MLQNVFGIDGRYFDVRIPEEGIKRSFSVADGDKAGRVITGLMVRDIIGTFYNYTISLDTSRLNPKEYDELYEIISAPEDYHDVTLPYGQTSKTFRMYITGGEDTLVTTGQASDGVSVWKGMSISVIMMEPLRKPGD